jgi:hypothetical protein
MDGLPAMPHNNAVHHYCVCDNRRRETFSMVTRLLSMDFYWFVELVLIRRLPEEVLLKESGVRHRKGQSIIEASVVLCEIVEDRRARVFGKFLIARMWVHVGRLWEKVRLESAVDHVSCYSEWWRQSIAGASKWQFSDGLYAGVLFWHASGLIAQRWIVLMCLESYWLHLTVVSWVLELK